tara:strand:+ start:2673 stop:3176 length:504 start_codon:yes stop_codon:yes gene_type:complete
MAGGGDAPSVPVWDMAVLAGSILVLSTIVIVTWTQPSTYTLDGSAQEVLTVNTGFSGGDLTFEASCLDDPCQTLTAWVVPHDGKESWSGGLGDATEIDLLNFNTTEISKNLNAPLPSGEFRIILDGEGTYTFETTIQRNVPHEYVPAIIGAFLVVWGVWRKQQEDID